MVIVDTPHRLVYAVTVCIFNKVYNLSATTEPLREMFIEKVQLLLMVIVGLFFEKCSALRKRYATSCQRLLFYYPKHIKECLLTLDLQVLSSYTYASRVDLVFTFDTTTILPIDMCSAYRDLFTRWNLKELRT